MKTEQKLENKETKKNIIKAKVRKCNNCKTTLTPDRRFNCKECLKKLGQNYNLDSDFLYC